MATLSDIIAKVRLVTGSPSPDQLSKAAITTYINNYYTLTMPQELKEQIENNYLQFKTVVGQDVYTFPTGYFTDSPGAYADGFPLIFYQDKDIFFQDWPQQYAVDNLFTGTGAQTNFVGGLQNPPIIIGSAFVTDGVQVLQDQGNSSAVSGILLATGNGSTASYSGTLPIIPLQPGSLFIAGGIENFTDNGAGILTGSLGGSGTINYTTGAWAVTFNANVATGVNVIAKYIALLPANTGIFLGNGFGTINYLTGAINITFNTAPSASATIYAKYQGYAGNRPQGVLFFQNTFTMRPVPDQVYQILMEGYIIPATLVNDTDTPLQPEWWQLIAFGASLDIFSDRGDQDNYDRYFPVFKRYENVALGRTIEELRSQQSVPRF